MDRRGSDEAQRERTPGHQSSKFVVAMEQLVQVSVVSHFLCVFSVRRIG